MIRHAIAAALVATFSFAPVAAQETIQTEAPKPVEEKKVCKRVVATGSVMPRVTCHTKAEWDAMSARGQADRRRVIDQETARGMVQQGR